MCLRPLSFVPGVTEPAFENPRGRVPARNSSRCRTAKHQPQTDFARRLAGDRHVVYSGSGPYDTGPNGETTVQSSGREDRLEGA